MSVQRLKLKLRAPSLAEQKGSDEDGFKSVYDLGEDMDMEVNDFDELLDLVKDDPVLSQPPEALDMLAIRSTLLRSDYFLFLSQLQKLKEVLAVKRGERDALLKRIADRKARMQQSLELVKQHRLLMEQVEHATHMISQMDNRKFAEMKAMKMPPAPLQHVITGCLLLMGIQKATWKDCRKFLADPKLKPKLLACDPTALPPACRQRAAKWVKEHHESFIEKRIRRVNVALVCLAQFVRGIVQLAILLDKVKDIDAFLKEVEEEQRQIAAMERTVALLDQFISNAGHIDGGWGEIMKKFNEEMRQIREKAKGLRKHLQGCAELVGDTLAYLDPENAEDYKDKLEFAVSPRQVLESVNFLKPPVDDTDSLEAPIKDDGLEHSVEEDVEGSDEPSLMESD